MPELVDEFAQAWTRPSSQQRFAPQAQDGVEPSFRPERCKPCVDATGLAGHADEPAGKRGHRAEQQQHFDALASACEAAGCSTGGRTPSAERVHARLRARRAPRPSRSIGGPPPAPRPTAAGRANAPHAWVPVNGSDTSAILDWRAWSAVLVRFRHLEDCAMRALRSTRGGCKSLIRPREMWGYLRVRVHFVSIASKSAPRSPQARIDLLQHRRAGAQFENRSQSAVSKSVI